MCRDYCWCFVNGKMLPCVSRGLCSGEGVFTVKKVNEFGRFLISSLLLLKDKETWLSLAYLYLLV